MAGSYPDVPSRRLSWDHDGTQCLYRTLTQTGDNTWKEPSEAQQEELNDEDDVIVIGSPKWPNGPSWYWMFTFPELRELEGYFSASELVDGVGWVQVSQNTTNGYDGTWVTIIADYTDPPTCYGYYRNLSYLLPQAEFNVKAVRVWNNGGTLTQDRKMKAFHLYGVVSPGQPNTRLIILDQYDGKFVEDKDYGDVPAASGDITTLKLKNTSTSLIAQNITVNVEDLYLGSSAWYTLSKDGFNFSSSINFTSIGTGGQQTFYLKRLIDGAFTPTGLHAARLNWLAATWSG